MAERRRPDPPGPAPRSRLVRVRAPRRPRAVALVLHGGAGRPGGGAVSPTQPSVLRMVPTALRLAAGGRRRLAVLRLLNSARGWDERRTPVEDVAWAVDQVADRWGADVPVALVGHSLGGRAALLAGGLDPVRTVVALAPWVYPDDAVGLDLTGRAVLVVHGDQDVVASPERAERLTERLARTGDATFVEVRGGKHAMLGRGGVFDGLAADFVGATLLGRRAGPVVRRALRGERRIEV